MNFIRKKQEGQNRAKFLVIGIFFVLFFTVFYFINQVSVAANPPNIITYQGKLLNNGSAVTTTQNIQFILCSDASCTTKLYTAGGTLASPTTINITPTNGIFSIDLGGSGTNALDPIIFKNNSNIYLEVTVNGEILLPRRQITAIPYAYNAKYLDGVGTATVSSSTYIPVSASDGSFNFTTTTISTSTITQADITNLNISGTISGLSSTQLSDTANLVRLNANNTFTGLNNFATGTFSAFRLGTSATSGYVLTTDANGYGTWKEIISGGSSISSLNGLTNATQTFSTSTSGGLLFDISSVGSNHTFTLGLANNYFIPLVASTTYWNTNANLVNDNYTNWNNAYQIVNTSSTLWDTAYNWGDHSTKGYLTSFAETDPLWSAVSTSLTVANFASNNISQWTNNVGYITSTSTDTLINKSGLISMWTNDRNYLTSYDETDPLWSAASSSYVRWDAASTTYWNTNANLVNDNYTNWNNAYQIVNTSSTLWDTAYNWGDHSTKGYLTSFAETDPLWSAVSTSLTVANFASNNISQWTNNVGYITSTSTDTLINKSGLISMWTNDRNYLTSYDETDPLWSAASSSYVRWDAASTTYWNTNANLVNDNYTNWNNAYQIVNTSSTLWDTAYNWGDHSTKGYLTSFAETDPLWSAVSTSLTVANFASNNISQWTNNVGYITSTSTDTLINKSGLISMWTNDRNYLTSYDETDPLWSAASSSYVRWDAASTTYWNTNANLVNDNYTNWNNAYQIVNTSSTLWDTAYNWGDHSTKGYLTSFDETDPLWSAVSTSLTVANFASNNISQWTNNVGYITSTSTDTLINKSGLISMWTNDRNYLTSYDETDPLWSAASSSYVRWDAASTTYWNTNANLVNDNYTNWNNAYQIVNTSSTLWDTAYNWGDHSTKGYLTSFAETDPLWSAVSTSLTVANFASNNISQWTNNVGYITSTSTDTLINKSGLISMWTNDRNYLTSFDETDPLWSAASSSYALLAGNNTFTGLNNFATTIINGDLNVTGNTTLATTTLNGTLLSKNGLFTSGVENKVTISEVVFSDPGFESWETSATPTYWGKMAFSPSGSVTQESTVVHGGSYSAKITAGATVDDKIFIYNNSPIQLTGDTFNFSYWVKNGTGKVGVALLNAMDGDYMKAYNFTGDNQDQWTDFVNDWLTSDQYVETDASDWTYVEHNNISISDTGELYIILISPQGAGAVGTYGYIDDLSVKENILTDVDSFIFDTQNIISSNKYLFNIKNNGTSTLALTGDGRLQVNNLILNQGTFNSKVEQIGTNLSDELLDDPELDVWDTYYSPSDWNIHTTNNYLFELRESTQKRSGNYALKMPYYRDPVTNKEDSVKISKKLSDLTINNHLNFSGYAKTTDDWGELRVYLYYEDLGNYYFYNFSGGAQGNWTISNNGEWPNNDNQRKVFGMSSSTGFNNLDFSNIPIPRNSITVKFHQGGTIYIDDFSLKDSVTSEEFFINGGFENWTPIDALVNYEFGNFEETSEVLVEKESIIKYSGNYSAKMITNASGNFGMLFKKNLNISDNIFKLSFWTRKGNGQGRLILTTDIDDETTYAYNFSGANQGQWTEFSLEQIQFSPEQIYTANGANDTWVEVVFDNLPTPSNHQIMPVWLAPAGNGEHCYFDKLSIKSYPSQELVSAFSFDTNQSFSSNNYLLNIKNNGISRMYLDAGGALSVNNLNILGSSLNFTNTTTVNTINFSTSSLFRSTAGSSPAFIFDATNFGTSTGDYLFSVRSAGQSKFSVEANGDVRIAGKFFASDLNFTNTTTVNTINFSTSSLFRSTAGSSPAFIFDATNFGTSTGDYLFSVRSAGQSKFSVEANGDVRIAGKFFASEGTVGTPGNPGDLAERVDVLLGEGVEAGDLMMVDFDNKDSYRKTVSTYEQKIAGVISTNPTLVLGSGKTSSTAVMAMIGRVPVKVNLENGPIKKGDYLVSSNQPGVAMKATEPGMAIGMALEDYEVVSNSNKILVYVNPRFVYGSFNENGEFEIFSSEIEPTEFSLLDNFTKSIAGSLKKLGLVIYEGILKVKELFAGKIMTDQLCVGETCVDENILKQLLQQNNNDSSITEQESSSSSEENTEDSVDESTTEEETSNTEETGEETSESETTSSSESSEETTTTELTENTSESESSSSSEENTEDSVDESTTEEETSNTEETGEETSESETTTTESTENASESESSSSETSSSTGETSTSESTAESAPASVSESSSSE